MRKLFTHYRLLALPVKENPAGGLLESLRWETRGGRTDLLMDYQALRLSAPSRLFDRDGRPWERLRGRYVPRRLRFLEANIVEGEKVGPSLSGLPPDSPERLLNATLAWRNLDGQQNFLIDLRRKEDDAFLLTAAGCRSEARSGPGRPVTLERDWSPPPLSPARLIPASPQLHRRFGGDPVPLQMGNLRLFVGGLDTQSRRRPEVGAVLNLAGEASLWAQNRPPHPADRWVHKGEGSQGMSVGELAEEAGWVIEHLQKGVRVLVHCTAGMNRSSTVCCAVLILLEGLSAEAALERVRTRHPWARPDPRHWLALRWLAAGKPIP